MSLDFRELKLRDYSKFHLVDNPFPAITVPEESPVILVDRERVLKSIRDVVVSAVMTGKSNTLVVTGAYGSGKSHLLKFAKTNINSQLSSLKENRTIAVYVENPRSYFRQFYSETVNGLGEAFVKDLVRTLVIRYMTSNPNELASLVVEKGKEQATANRIISGVSYKSQNLDVIFESGVIRHGDLLHRIHKTYENKFRLRDYLDVAFKLLTPTFESSSWRWLSSERITRTEKDEVGASSEIEEQNALDAFHDLRILFSLGGFGTLVILLDELERITELHRSLESRYFDDLRHFVDNNTEGICLIACVTPTAFGEIQASGHPLERRLLSNTDRLDPFDVPLTINLVKAYLANSRNRFLEQHHITPSTYSHAIQEKYKNADADLFPFDNAVVKWVHEFTGGNIGFTLVACRKLLDEASDKKMDVISDQAFVDSVLKTEA